MRSEITIYASFFLLGMGTVIPFNFFVTPFAYWMTKLQKSNWNNNTIENDSTLDHTDGTLNHTLQNKTCTTSYEFNNYQKFWNSSLLTIFMAINLVFSFLTTILTACITRRVRFISSMIGYLLCFIVTLVMVWINTENWIPQFFMLTLIMLTILPVCQGIFQTSLLGLAAEFPPKFSLITASIGGQGFGGIFASVINLITLAAFQNPQDSAFVFFLLAIIFIISNLIIYIRLPGHRIYKRYSTDVTAQRSQSYPAQTTDSCNDIPQTDDSDDKIITFSAFVLETLWPYMLSIFLTFFVTLGIYPAAVSFAQATDYDCNNEYHAKWFIPVWCFTIFNIGDTLGRFLTDKITMIQPQESKKLLAIAVSRLIFMIILPMCNILPDERHTSVLISSDAAYIILMFLMAFSGGIVIGFSMRYSVQVAPKHLYDAVGTTMSTCLVAGLFGGACFSFAVIAII